MEIRAMTSDGYYVDEENYYLGLGINKETLQTIRIRSTAIILNTITAENKIACLIYIICHRAAVFKKMYEANVVSIDDLIKCITMQPKCLFYLPYRVKINENFRNALIENVQPDWYDYLPKDIADRPDIQIKCNRTAQLYDERGRDKNGYDINWRDWNGNLISFFTLEGDFPIRSKEDYIKLYEEYLNSKTSVSVFCVKYKISSPDGFNEMLKRIQAESYIDKKTIRDFKNDVGHRFFNFSLEIIRKIVNKEMTFEDYINNYYTPGATNVSFYFSKMNQSDKTKFALEVLDYMSKNPYLLSNNFFKFFDDHRNSIEDNLHFYIKRNLPMPEYREQIQRFYDILKIIKGHFQSYNRQQMYCKYIINGTTYQIDDDIIDQAYAYCNDKEYTLSKTAMIYLCKQIAMGNIAYKKEMEEEKEEMIDSIAELILKGAEMKDYIEYRKQQQNKR